jgi:hypothetical protein
MSSSSGFKEKARQAIAIMNSLARADLFMWFSGLIMDQFVLQGRLVQVTGLLRAWTFRLRQKIVWMIVAWQTSKAAPTRKVLSFYPV